ncbi:MAG: hypothetical protein ABH889_01080 [Candidatus Portnoybacteria bacterium]
MIKIKTINYGLGALIILSFALPVQSQTPEVTLTWSTDTYIPLDYPGKALPVEGSNVEIIANINSSLNSQELIYDWSVNTIDQKDKSGRGKQSLLINIPKNSNNLMVKTRVSDKNGKFLGNSSYLTIPVRRPEAVIKPGGALLNSAYQISAGQEEEFTVESYFFNINSLDQLDYFWKLGRQEALPNNTDRPNSFILKINPLAQPITQDLIVEIENKNIIFQKAQTKIKINITP